MNTIWIILIVIIIILLLPIITYVLSVVQMKAWKDAFFNHQQKKENHGKKEKKE